MPKSKIATLLDALNILKGADPDLVEALSDDATLAKGVLQNGSEKLRPGELVEGHFLEGQTNRSATAEQVKTGPAQEASGGGAEKMVKEYSNPVTQVHGVAETPMALADMLHNFNASMKAISNNLNVLANSQTAIKALLSALVKADHEDEAQEETDEEEDEEESEVVEINASRAKSLILKAKVLIKKAKKAEALAEDEPKDEEKCKALKAEAKALRKAAGKLLGKARSCAYAAKSLELKKSVRALAAKADVDVVQEQEEDEEDEEDDGEEQTKAAKAAKAAKAKTDIAGNQADHADPKTGNQAAEAAKSAVSPDDLQKALAGIATLQTTVAGMLDVVSGKSRVSDQVPNIAKATLESLNTIPERIMDMEDSGTLSMTDAFAARDIFSKLELVKGGKLDPTVVTDRLAKTTASVRSLFSDVLRVA